MSSTAAPSAPVNGVASDPLLPAAPPPADPALAGLDEAVQYLALKCMEVEYSISGLPAARQASATAKEAMVRAVDGKAKGYSVSKRLFASNHPLIGELNAARRRIDEWRDAHTIVKSAEAETRDGKLAVAPGVRLIQTDTIPEFDKGYHVRVAQLYEAAAAVQEHMRKEYVVGGKVWPSILDMDRERLGKDFNEADYPADVRDCIRATDPTYRDYKVAIQLPEEIRKRQEARLHDALSSTIEAAVDALTGTLTETFETLANQLVTRTRIYPPVKDPLGSFSGAELIRTVEHDDGTLTLTVRCVDARQADRAAAAVADLARPRAREFEIGPISRADYVGRLRPLATDEKKKITTSVIDNLFTQLRNFSNLKDMLGAPGAKIEAALDQVRALLAAGGGSGAAVADELKKARTFRAGLSAALEQVTTELARNAEEVRAVRKKIKGRTVELG